MILIVSGYIAHAPHKYSHLIDIEDKKIVEALINKYDKEIIHIVSSPGAFNEAFKSDRVYYKLISEDQDLVQNWISANYGKYATIISVSDGCITPSLSGLSLKKLILFNTDIMGNDQDPMNLNSVIAINADSLDIFYGRIAVFRFIQDSEQFYITDNHLSTHMAYGIDNMVNYITSLDTAKECEIELYQPKSFPDEDLVATYKEYHDIISDLQINMHMLIYDRTSETYMMSGDKDNSTFAIIQNKYIGVETGRTKVSYDIPMDFFKMAVALKIKSQMHCCIHWDALYNNMMSRYIVRPYPFSYLPSKDIWRTQIDTVAPAVDSINDLGWGLIYEEGHGYYLIATSPNTLGMAFREIMMLTAPISNNEYLLNATANKAGINWNLKKSVYDKLVKSIISEYSTPQILIANNIDDNILSTDISKQQMFYSNPLSKNINCFNGPIHPQMKYDIILFYGTYEYQSLSYSEQLLKWKKMKSMLSDGGKIIIVGPYQRKHDNSGKNEIEIETYKGGVVTYRTTPASETTTKRTMAINSSEASFTCPYSPLETDLLNVLANDFIIDKQRLKDIYCYTFKPRKE